MTCATIPKVIEMTTTTPSVDQKRPRVSAHDRPMARKTGARSRMMTDGTRKSLGVSHRYSGISAMRARMPTRMPTHTTAIASSATMPASRPTASTVAVSTRAL